MRWSLAAIILLLTTVACNSPSVSISGPTDFTVMARAGRIELSWQYDAEAALGFVILRQEASSEAALATAPFRTLTEVAADTTTFTDNTVTEGQYYRYQIQALSGGGRSSPATSESITPRSQQVMLSVLRVGQGSGVVTSEPAGISCTADGTGCQATFAAETEITLTATPNASSDFAGFSGACSGASCTLVLETDEQVTVTFNEAGRSLNVTLTGEGSGQVTLSPGGASCETAASPCQVSFAIGTTVSARAEPASGSRFVGWSGACSGSGSCQMTMSENRELTANFERIPPPVIDAFEVSEPVILQGEATELSWLVASETPVSLFLRTDSGDEEEVTGMDFAIVSPETTTTYTLVARNAGGEVSASVTVTVEDAFTLVVVRNPANSARTVRSSPSGINCGLDCSQTYPPGEVVRLSAGTIFVTWTGCDRVTGTTCIVTMDANKTVTANFIR